MRQIENIIFDLGNVLLNFKPLEYLDELFNNEELVAKLHKVVFASPEWFMLDRGVISQQEAIARLVNQYPSLEREIVLTFSGWFAILTPIGPTVELLQQLKEKNYRIYALSNFHSEAFSAVQEKYAWFSLFDGQVISYQVQALKPEPEIYTALLEKYSLRPENSIFIDDSLANVEGARRLGIAGIHYQTSQDLKLELEAILGLESFN